MMEGLRDFGLSGVLARNAQVRGDALAYDGPQGTVSHAEHAAACRRLAAALAGAGIAAGDRIAVLSENRQEIYTLLGACAYLGAMLVPLNWRLAEAELAAQLADADVALVIADTPVPSGARRIDFAGLAALPALAGVEESGDRPLCMIYTAAVDGQARGAVLTGANLVAGAVQLVAAAGLTAEDRFLGNLPMFHIMAISFSLAVQIAGGATIIRPRFEAEDAARTIAAGATVMGSFPPMIASVLDAADAAGIDLAPLRRVIGLDAPDTIARLHRLPKARFWTGFGQTETAGFCTFADAGQAPGTAGWAGNLSTLAIHDETGSDTAPGQVGDIVLRGPAVMQGYWRREEETAQTFRGGWHHTGDLGRFDDGGRLVYAGRSPAKSLIKTGGENVYPVEVEQALCAHEEVSGACVFGRADPRWGEAVVAVCETASPALTEDALAEFVATRIARYKRPRHILLVPTLPRLADGRIDRAAAVALAD